MMTGFADPGQLLAELQSVRGHVTDEGAVILSRWEPMLKRGAFSAGAANLASYLALRELDLRPLQKALVGIGLTGLGRSESRVMPTLDAVAANLALLSGAANGIQRPPAEVFWSGADALTQATDALFGAPTEGRITRILVTMAPKAAKDKDHVREL